jgi:hypothetical protein
VVLSWVVKMLVDSNNKGGVLARGRRRDKNLLCSGFDVLDGILGIGETSS